jgi:hypothetical protein
MKSVILGNPCTMSSAKIVESAKVAMTLGSHSRESAQYRKGFPKLSAADIHLKTKNIKESRM